MALSLKPNHLTRYKDIAALLVKYGRSGALRSFDPDGPAPDDPTIDDPTIDDDGRRLAGDLEAMGPTFIKLGQLLSTRADLLPPAYLEALSRLQDDVEPVSFEVIEETVTREIGARISNAFQSFESTPRASASLGQVHRAVLRDGRPVAVKVQRPGIRQRIVDDMEVIEELAEFLDTHTGVGRAYGFRGMAEEFRRSIMAELDYRLEAANLRLLGSQLADYQRIVVPQPIDDYTTSTVLTMDLVDGRNVGALGPLATLETDRCALARDLFDAYLDQILVHGFVHADPHPGNVLLTTDGRLALIDLGMVVRIAPELQDDLVRLLLALSEGDGTDVSSILAGLGEKRENWDRLRFEREISALVQRNQAVTVGQLEAGRMVGELARIAGDCGLRPPVELTMLGKTLLNLDQVANKVDPDFDPNAAIQDHVGKIMRRKMLQSASPAHLLSAAMDAKEFVEKLPARVNKVMDALAEGQMTLNIQGIDEKELMRGIQKLANRVTAGLVIAALIVGAAMLMQIDTEAKLFGYPSVAIVCFLAAAAAGVWLIASSLLHDLPQRRHRRKTNLG
jgi:predicted unusual protein kinase regulating ubiquinone biosynthesis (AarF/ABC1/UbiB family)